MFKQEFFGMRNNGPDIWPHSRELFGQHDSLLQNAQDTLNGICLSPTIQSKLTGFIMKTTNLKLYDMENRVVRIFHIEKTTL